MDSNTAPSQQQDTVPDNAHSAQDRTSVQNTADVLTSSDARTIIRQLMEQNHALMQAVGELQARVQTLSTPAAPHTTITGPVSRPVTRRLPIPDKLDAETSSMDVEQWLSLLEEYFAASDDFPDQAALRVRHAATLLRGTAHRWWRHEKARYDNDDDLQTLPTWTETRYDVDGDLQALPTWTELAAAVARKFRPRSGLRHTGEPRRPDSPGGSDGRRCG